MRGGVAKLTVTTHYKLRRSETLYGQEETAPRNSSGKKPDSIWGKSSPFRTPQLAAEAMSYPHHSYPRSLCIGLPTGPAASTACVRLPSPSSPVSRSFTKTHNVLQLLRRDQRVYNSYQFQSLMERLRPEIAYPAIVQEEDSKLVPSARTPESRVLCVCNGRIE